MVGVEQACLEVHELLLSRVPEYFSTAQWRHHAATQY
jgi:hypothetical protein